MSRFAIIVTIKLKPGMGDAFEPHILKNATAAVRDEQDCHMFHVSRAEDDPDTFFFYEVYTGSAALDVHRETPHYKKFFEDAGKKFFEDAGDMVAERSIQRVTVINPENIA